MLGGGGGYFFRQLSDAVGSTDDQALAAAIWDLVWAGHLTNDTLAPLRTRSAAGGRTAHRARRRAPRVRSSPARAVRGLPTRTGPPTAPGGGRCCRRARPIRPAARTPPPRGCSSGTAS